MATHYLAANVFFTNNEIVVINIILTAQYASIWRDWTSRKSAIRNTHKDYAMPEHQRQLYRGTMTTLQSRQYTDPLIYYMATGVNGITTTPGSPQDFTALCKNSPDFPTELRAFICQPDRRWTKSKQRKKS